MQQAIITIDLGAICHNYQRFVEHTSTPLYAVVKANAYGHGLIEVAQALQQSGCGRFAVARVDEALQLRKAGINGRILVLGVCLSEHAAAIDAELELAISSLSELSAITQQCCEKTAKVQIKVDSGMNRLGSSIDETESLLHKALIHCKVTGIFNHFACADDVDLGFTHEQFSRFHSLCEQLKIPASLRIERHICNTAGAIRCPQYRMDSGRIGIGLYGVYPAAWMREQADKLDLKPALALHSPIALQKSISAGQSTSYGRAWSASKTTTLAHSQVGYGDGYFRALGDKAQVAINGRLYPIVGRICMDQFAVDLGRPTTAKTMELIGNQLRVEDLAEAAGTIPYEILSHLGQRISRRYR